MNIAYELAQAGDPLGAMQFIEVGLEIDPEDTDQLKQHGGFAFTAGAEAAIGFEEMPPEAVDLYQKALASFATVYGLEGAEMDVRYLRNMVAANINLGEYQAAVDLSERVLETHASEPSLWSYYADALQRVGRVDDAITALGRIVSLDPEYPNVGAARGSGFWTKAGSRKRCRFSRLPWTGVSRPPTPCADFVCSTAYSEGIQAENWGYAIETLRLAKEFEISDDMRQQVDFCLGYAILKAAIADRSPRPRRPLQATLPRFQEALRLMQIRWRVRREGRTWTHDASSLIGNINTYIEIQEAIIRRGR